MKTILVIGAGRSASSLIKYFLDNSQKENWKVIVGDVSLDLAKQKTNNHPNAKAIAFNINNQIQREEEISNADLMVSMLPATMHLKVAEDCVRLKKHLVTASYLSKEMKALNEEAKNAGVILLNEAGLDPGIDHMSAMKIIDEQKTKGNQIISFKSYCGGLIAPESNDNAWGYKFTWNPRNVVLAGQGGDAQFIESGTLKSIPYEKLFEEIEMVEVDGHGKFEAYANRDSLSYRKPYGLENIPTMLRGTLRMPGFCKAWNVLIKLGLTNDSQKLFDSDKWTWRELIKMLNPKISDDIMQYIEGSLDPDVLEKLDWLELFSNKKITIANATPAQILQNLLEKKWKLQEDDKDMIVMQHQFLIRNQKAEVQKITSSFVLIGEDHTYTAMAKTVGLPAAICAKLILKNKIKSRGAVIPTIKEIYYPVLTELESYGIKFLENVSCPS